LQRPWNNQSYVSLIIRLLGLFLAKSRIKDLVENMADKTTCLIHVDSIRPEDAFEDFPNKTSLREKVDIIDTLEFRKFIVDSRTEE
jgi:hypothetical protein